MTRQYDRARCIAIDTDPGIDDALALMLAFASDEIRVELVTTVAGNVPLARVTDNARRVLSLLRPDPMPELARGAARPLRRALVDAAYVHGDDGLGGLSALRSARGEPRFGTEHAPAVRRNAVNRLIELVESRGASLTVVALGPLTNLALALEQAPEIMARLGRLVVMGGAMETAGNITAAAEFNFHADPDAAERVLGAGLPTILVPLDVTRQVTLSARELRGALGTSRSPRTTAIRAMTRQLLRRTGVLTLHDPLAMAVALDPHLVRTRTLPVWVETRGVHTLGLSLTDRRAPETALHDERPPVQIALQVDRERVLSLFSERVLRPPPRRAGQHLGGVGKTTGAAPRVVVLGGANLDISVTAASLPHRGETVAGGHLLRDFGGKGANQAVASRRAGATVHLIAKLGADADGDRYVSHLEREGIAADGLLRDDTNATGTALIMVDAQGENLISVAPGANDNVQISEIESMAPLIASARLLIAPLEVPAAALQRAFAIARSHGVATLLNAAPARPLTRRLTSMVDVLVVNEVEAALLSGKRVHPSRAPHAAATALRRQGFARIVITLGAAGAWWYDDDDRAHMPPDAVDAVDTVGAGDTFVGYLGCALAEGAGLGDSVRLATHAAALSVQRAGAQSSIPRRWEVGPPSR